MRCLLFLVISFCITPVFAGGCPPWLPCGKFKNLIIADPDYDSVVASGLAAAAQAANSPQVPDQELNDLIDRIKIQESLIPGMALNSAFRMRGDSSDAARQREVLQRPQPQIWVFDWGQTDSK